MAGCRRNVELPALVFLLNLKKVGYETGITFDNTLFIGTRYSWKENKNWDGLKIISIENLPPFLPKCCYKLVSL